MGKPIEKFNVKDYNDEFIKNLYDENFHNYHWKLFRPRNLNAARLIYEALKPTSVVDFGCSIGTYLEYFLSKDVNIKGYEYSYDACIESAKKVPGLAENIFFGDVTKKINVDKKYDLAMSIEVAEHIPTEFSDVLVDNLCSAAKNHIFFTAALPGQGGTGHINCQPKEFWIEKFNKNGWFISEDFSSKIKSSMIPKGPHMPGGDDGINDFPCVWSFVYNNMMVFVKK